MQVSARAAQWSSTGGACDEAASSLSSVLARGTATMRCPLTHGCVYRVSHHDSLVGHHCARPWHETDYSSTTTVSPTPLLHDRLQGERPHVRGALPLHVQLRSVATSERGPVHGDRRQLCILRGRRVCLLSTRRARGCFSPWRPSCRSSLYPSSTAESTRVTRRW